MLGNMLKLLAFAAVFSVAPATASHRSAPHHSTCPWERAREAAAAAMPVRTAAAVKAPTVITLNNRLQATDGGVFGFGSGPGAFNP
jgi:hypothetical protein